MTEDTVIELAKQAGFLPDVGIPVHPSNLFKFAALVAAAEREECAKVLEKLEQEWEDAELWASFKTIGIAIDAIRSKK